jgi:hypothetical protein
LLLLKIKIGKLDLNKTFEDLYKQTTDAKIEILPISQNEPTPSDNETHTTTILANNYYITINAQKQGKELIDSLVTKLSKAKEETLKQTY